LTNLVAVGVLLRIGRRGRELGPRTK